MGGAFVLSQPNCGTTNYGKKERPWMSKAYGWSGNYNKITWLEKKWQWWWKRFQLFIAWRMVLSWCCWYIRETDEGMISFSMSIFFTFVYTTTITLQIVIITCVYIDISFVIFVHNHDLFFWINNSLHGTRW